jgi:hypothetical protein
MDMYAKWMIVVFFAIASCVQARADDTVADSQFLNAFLKSHCNGCHGGKKPEGGIVLRGLAIDAKSPADLATWERVYEQVEGRRMPPIDEAQPTLVDRDRARVAVKSLLAARDRSVDVLRSLHPSRGNWVDHAALFSDKALGETATPARAWRLSPEGYRRFMLRLSEQFGLDLRANDGDPVGKTRAPWSMPEKWDFTDYASSHRVSGIEMENHVRNCTIIAQQMLPRVKNGSGPLKKLAAVIRDGKSATLGTINAAVAEAFLVLLHLPLDESELTRYGGQFAKDLQVEEPASAVEQFLISVLCHREAIYRIERPQGDAKRGMMAPRHLARAISYTLADREPDAALWAAADNGSLNSPDVVRQQVQRLWGDPELPKSRLQGFFREYFGYGPAADQQRCDPDMVKMDAKLNHHEFLPGPVVADTDKLVGWVLESDQQVLRTLLTTRKSFLSSPTYDGYLRQVAQRTLEKKRAAEQAAKTGVPFDEKDKKYAVELNTVALNFDRMLYGVMPPAEWKTYRITWPYGGTRMPMPKGPGVTVEQWLAGKGTFEVDPDERMGILTQPSWLIAMSTNFDNHAIHRGKWIRERLLGGTIPDVPITVDARLPLEPHRSLRDRMKVTREEYCWKCHRLMDPLGLPFEQFDHYGRYRPFEIVDNPAKKTNKSKNEVFTTTVPLDTTGGIEDSGVPQLDGPVKTPFELIEKLAKSEHVEQVFVRHVFRYFLGRNETLADGPVLVAAHKAYRDSGGSFKALLVSLLSSESFLFRTVPVLAKNSQ